MRRPLALLVAVVVIALAAAAPAAEWGLIEPGVSTTATVRATHGAPERVDRQKVESYDTESWVYEGDRAPVGMHRLTVEFGLVQGEKFRPEIVRAFRLEPKPGSFTRGVITQGWGLPDRLGHENAQDIFLYRDGLLVYFDETGWNAKLMVFTVPQPRDPTEEPRSR
jgi:hypothetical protein